MTRVRAAWRGGFLLAAAAALVLLLSAAPAGAQASGPSLGGTLRGPEGPVEGVRLEALADEEVIGESFSDAEGRWTIPVPGPGLYSVTLDTSTLPEGVELRDPDRATLTAVDVQPNQAKVVLFPFVTGDSAGSSRLELFISLLVSGVRFGLVIALCAVGLSLIFGTTGLINFAHGELVTGGAIIAWYLNSPSQGLGLHIGVAAVLAVILAAAAGWLLDAGLWAPLRRRRTGNVALIVVSIGLALFLRYFYLVLFEGNPRPFAQYATQPPWEVGPLSIRPKELVVIAVCLVALLGLAFWLLRTRFGTAVRAVADNRDLAESSGIDVRRVIRLVWAGGTALAGLGGIMLGMTESVQWDMGFRVLLVIFAAVVVGGLGSSYGAVMGGLLIGVVSEVSAFWFPTDFKVVFALGALILVLLVRPQGFFGVQERIG